MVNYVYRPPQDNTLLLKCNITLLLEPPEMSFDIYTPCRLLLPVLARTLEEMFNLNDDYYFQLTNSSCLAF